MFSALDCFGPIYKYEKESELDAALHVSEKQPEKHKKKENEIPEQIIDK